MSWITSVAGVLFGGSKTSDKIVDGGVSALDKMWHTDEEKSDANRTLFELYIDYQKATSPQNAARRLLMLIVTGTWAILVLTTGTFIGFGEDEIADKYIDLLDRGKVGWAFVGVTSFYFLKRFKIGNS